MGKYIISYHTLWLCIYVFCVFTECAIAPNAMTVLLAVVGSILLMGIVLLALWKLVITIHDRREFARFQSARSRARYEMVRFNPSTALCLIQMIEIRLLVTEMLEYLFLSQYL